MRNLLLTSTRIVFAADKEGAPSEHVHDATKTDATKTAPKTNARKRKPSEVSTLPVKSRNAIVNAASEIKTAIESALDHQKAVGDQQQVAAFWIVKMSAADNNVLTWLRNPKSDKFSLSALMERVYGAAPKIEKESEDDKKVRQAVDGKRRAMLNKAVDIARLVTSPRAKGAAFDTAKGCWNVPSKLLLGDGEKFVEQQPKTLPLDGETISIRSSVIADGKTKTKYGAIQLSAAQLVSHATGRTAARAARKADATKHVTPTMCVDALCTILAKGTFSKETYKKATDGGLFEHLVRRYPGEVIAAQRAIAAADNERKIMKQTDNVPPKTGTNA